MLLAAPIGLALLAAAVVAEPASRHGQLVGERYSMLLQLDAQLENCLGAHGVAPEPARL